MEEEILVDKVRQLIRPLLDSRHVELVELICRNAGPRVLVRCLVDTVKGITLQELSFLSQAIGAVLEEHDVIPSAYWLEVNSPGLDRPLKSPADFERVIGRRIRVSAAVTLLDGQRETVGELLSAGEVFIVVKVDTGEKVQIFLADIAKAVQEVRI